MKSLLVVMALLISSAPAQIQRSLESRIPVVHTFPQPDWKNPARHEEFDVEVGYLGKFGTDSLDAFFVNIYLKREGDSLAVSSDGFGEKEPGRNYDVAYYRWLNDSTVTVRLVDTASGRQRVITRGWSWISRE